jgi:hypothetical protein
MISWGLLGLEGIPRGCAVLSLIYFVVLAIWPFLELEEDAAFLFFPLLPDGGCQYKLGGWSLVLKMD